MKVIINGLTAPNLEIMGIEPAGAEERARAYADQKFSEVSQATPTLEELGGEPAGAESRARLYTDQKFAEIGPPALPTLEELGGEPAGAESRARQYTDIQIAKIPPPALPTLEELGGEPVGAEARANAYTDLKISELPAMQTPTLAELGGEPIGAELRANAYTDTQFSLLQARIFALEDRVSANEAKLATWVPYALRINCGTSSISYLDSQGGSWLRDSYFSGGNAFDVVNQGGAQTATGTSDPTIYRYERSLDNGTFTYTIPVSAGTYTVKLHFCENYHNAANLRVGTVKINNNTVLSAFDIWSQAGGRYKALIKSFTGIVSSGSISIAITNTLLNGIELIRTA